MERTIWAGFPSAPGKTVRTGLPTAQNNSAILSHFYASGLNVSPSRPDQVGGTGGRDSIWTWQEAQRPIISSYFSMSPKSCSTRQGTQILTGQSQWLGRGVVSSNRTSQILQKRLLCCIHFSWSSMDKDVLAHKPLLPSWSHHCHTGRRDSKPRHGGFIVGDLYRWGFLPRLWFCWRSQSLFLVFWWFFSDVVQIFLWWRRGVPETPDWAD